MEGELLNKGVILSFGLNYVSFFISHFQRFEQHCLFKNLTTSFNKFIILNAQYKNNQNIWEIILDIFLSIAFVFCLWSLHQSSSHTLMPNQCWTNKRREEKRREEKRREEKRREEKRREEKRREEKRREEKRREEKRREEKRREDRGGCPILMGRFIWWQIVGLLFYPTVKNRVPQKHYLL